MRTLQLYDLHPTRFDCRINSPGAGPNVCEKPNNQYKIDQVEGKTSQDNIREQGEQRNLPKPPVWLKRINQWLCNIWIWMSMSSVSLFLSRYRLIHQPFMNKRKLGLVNNNNVDVAEKRAIGREGNGLANVNLDLTRGYCALAFPNRLRWYLKRTMWQNSYDFELLPRTHVERGNDVINKTNRSQLLRFRGVL